jgi:hypothetical protein
MIRQLRRAQVPRDWPMRIPPRRSDGWQPNAMCLMLYSGTIRPPGSAMPWERGHSADIGKPFCTEGRRSDIASGPTQSAPAAPTSQQE